jgi:NADH dehydrogenase FAD-containing subunit
MSVRQNFVIVGGGCAGTTLARLLSSSLNASKYRLILISARPFFVHLPATARMSVTDRGDLEKTALIPYDKLFVNGNGEFKLGTVKSFTDAGERGGVVILEDGEQLDYITLVLATGSSWPEVNEFPNSAEGAQAHVNKHRSAVRGASNIVVVGGGSVGIGERPCLICLQPFTNGPHRNRRRNQR